MLGGGLSLRPSPKSGAAPPAGLPAHTTDAAAATYFAAADAISVLPARRKLTINRMFKQLRSSGILAKLSELYLGAVPTSGMEVINLIAPGTRNLTPVGTPTFTKDFSVAGAASVYYNTGKFASDLAQNDHSLFIFHTDKTGNTATSIGGLGASTTGVSLNPYNTTPQILARSATSGVQSTSTPVNVTDSGYGLTLASRRASTDFQIYANAVQANSHVVASVAMPAAEMVVGGLNNNGTRTGSTRPWAFAGFGVGLTQAESARLSQIMFSAWHRIAYGETLYEMPGFGTTNINAQVIIYGATPAGLAAAYEAKRAGKTVAIIGGWRERHLGGMMSGGLGRTDIDNQAAIGGLSLWAINRMLVLNGQISTLLNFQPRYAEGVFNAWFDPQRTGGLDVPVYYTTGVVSTVLSGGQITSFNTTDGRTVTGSVFIDASYEGDLMALAGVTYRIGREAAGTGNEAYNGFRGNAGSIGFANSATTLRVDPFITPATPASGLLPGVSFQYDGITPAAGAADVCTFKNKVKLTGATTPLTQAYAFRLIVVNDANVREAPINPSVPAGYSLSRYELMYRWSDAAVVQGNPLVPQSDMMLDVGTQPVQVNNVGHWLYDVNTSGGQSMDYINGNINYIEANYATRETIWKDHEGYQRGWFWAIQNQVDARITTNMMNVANRLTLSQTHFTDPHENDTAYWPYNLYIREARRMVGTLDWTASDLNQADGGTPRSTKIISCASYALDSHMIQLMADNSLGQWITWAEGSYLVTTSNGVNDTAPLPYEIFCPQAAECTNLLVLNTPSCTHTAWGSIRMELTGMASGQGCGRAASIAIDGATTVQAVDYTTLRAQLLASPSLSGEVAPVIPQVS